MKLPLPKLKIFGSKTEDPDADEEISESEDPKESFFRRNSRLLPVYGAYGLFALLVVSTAVYLILNEDSIRAEHEAAIPSVTIRTIEGMPPAAPVAQSPSMTAEGDGSEQSDSDAPATSSVSTSVSEDGPDPYAGNLTPHPDPKLVELVEAVGQLPVIGEDGRLPWKVYARPSSSLETRPQISVVVLNLGLSTLHTEQALRLPGSVTLSFSPYARGLEGWISQARDAGHEVLIGLPMQPRDFPRSDAGLLQLMTTFEPERNILNLHRVLAGSSGYIGTVNMMGSGFTASQTSLEPVMEDLAKRGLVYLDTLVNATSLAPQEAARAGVPAATADLFIDQDMARTTILSRLAQIELLAKSQKSAIVTIQPYPMLMEQVGNWARGLATKNLALTPLSGVITARQRRE